MIRSLLRCVSAALCCLVFPTSRAKAEPELTLEKVTAVLPQLEKLATEALQQSGVPGLSIAVVYKDRVVYLKGFGVREAGKPEPVDADTVFQIASMSKPIAATVVAALVSDKRVTWDDPICQRDPAFQMYDSWATREVTIRDMFSHRSGLRGAAGDDLEEYGYDQAEVLRRLRFLKPGSSLRSHYAYSNFGLTEGAIAAARATGKAWPEVCAEKLYRPLGMNATSSRYADYAAAKNRALIHVLVAGKWVAKFTRQPDAQSPAGGVSSSARDLAQWIRLELGAGKFNGKPLIASDALAETHQPQIVRGSNPSTGQPSFYGLGWGVDYDDKGRVFWSHAGAFSLGARTQVKLLPAEELGIVVLSNAFPTGVPDGLADAFFDLVLNGKQARDWVAFWNKQYNTLVTLMTAGAKAYATPPAKPLPALPSKAYRGVYANDYFGRVEIVEQGGALSLRLGPKKRTFPLTHWDRDMFVFEASPEFPGALSGVTFVLGPDRQAQQVIVEAINDAEQGTFARLSVEK